MKAIAGFAILIGFNAAGIWLHDELQLLLPGNVLGLILFLIALWTKLIRLEWVEQAANVLLKHMLLFFVPYVVGTITFFPLLAEHWVSILVGIVGSTFAVLFVTGYVAQKSSSANHPLTPTETGKKGSAA